METQNIIEKKQSLFIRLILFGLLMGIFSFVIIIMNIKAAEFKISVDEPVPNYIQNNTDSEENFMIKLLFNESDVLKEYFVGIKSGQGLTNYLPLRLDYFRMSRVVMGDISNLRNILYKINIKKQCLNIAGIGGSVTVGHGVGGIKNSWTNHLEIWLNGYYVYILIDLGTQSQLSSRIPTKRHFYEMPLGIA